MSAGEASRHVVGFLDFCIDVFLEVQNKRYSLILYLIDYIVYGLHLWYKILIFKEICPKPIPLHPGLGSSLHRWCPPLPGASSSHQKGSRHQPVVEHHTALASP